MSKIIEKARTINEKRANFSDDSAVDYSYLAEWRNVRTLLSDKCFESMLKENDFSEEEFVYALQPSENGVSFEEDKWYDIFLDLISAFKYQSIDYKAGVHILALPFSKYLVKSLKKTLEKIENVQVSEYVINNLIEAHFLEMFSITGKLIAVELEKYKQKKCFANKSKEARFREFLKAQFHSKASYLTFFEEYPVAARLMTIRTVYMVRNFTEILANVNEDAVEIQNFLKIDKLCLTKISVSTGDSHEQGKSVSILVFNEKKLVYKPKDLRIGLALERFIEWYTSRSDLLAIKIPKGIYKEGYTYNEFIEQKCCNNESEVSNFYLRYGYLTAICYLLGINDLHLENVIADGEHPVIIDIETIFQNLPTIENSTIYFDLIKKLNIESVNHSCLLPQQMSVGLKDQVELSALKGKRTKLSSSYLAPVGINTDNFHFEKKAGYFEGGANLPKCSDEKAVDYNQYSLKIIEGFSDFMAFALGHKKEYLAQLEFFKGYPIRVLLKGTERYASMIRYSSHPNYNYEMKYRERLMMNIWAYAYKDKRIIRSEVSDLLFNDIPIFYSYPNSRNVLDSHGFVYENYYEKSGFDLAVERIKKLSEQEIATQSSLMYFSLGLADRELNQKDNLREIIFPPQKIDYLKQAELVAEQLIQKSYVKGDEASLLSIDCDSDKHWSLIPCDESLTDGLSGVAVFFIELYAATQKKRYFTYYKRYIHAAVVQAKHKGVESAFSGRLAPIYPLLLEYNHFNSLHEKDYLDETIEKLRLLSIDDLEKLRALDYLSGCAGILKLLTSMQAIIKSDNGSLKEVIVRLSKVFM